MNNPVHYIAIKDEVDKNDKFSPQINKHVQAVAEINQSQSDQERASQSISILTSRFSPNKKLYQNIKPVLKVQGNVRNEGKRPSISTATGM